MEHHSSDHSLSTSAIVLTVLATAVAAVLILVKFVVTPRCCKKRSVGVEPTNDVEGNDMTE